MTDHDELSAIWLSPRCDECSWTDRTWCDEPQDACDCGRAWVKFTLAPVEDAAT